MSLKIALGANARLAVDEKVNVFLSNVRHVVSLEEDDDDLAKAGAQAELAQVVHLRERATVARAQVQDAPIKLVPDEAAEEIENLLANKAPSKPNIEPDEEDKEVDRIYRENQSKAIEFIKDKVSKLDWDEMQDLVAGLLRGMGYKTRVSNSGPDRGKDIVASPDGLGFESPRIVVEVKHRTN